MFEKDQDSQFIIFSGVVGAFGALGVVLLAIFLKTTEVDFIVQTRGMRTLSSFLVPALGMMGAILSSLSAIGRAFYFREGNRISKEILLGGNMMPMGMMSFLGLAALGLNQDADGFSTLWWIFWTTAVVLSVSEVFLWQRIYRSHRGLMGTTRADVLNLVDKMEREQKSGQGGGGVRLKEPLWETSSERAFDRALDAIRGNA